MYRKETETWIAQLWTSSVALALMFGVTMGSGIGFTAPLMVTILWFGISFVSWILRVTYLAGRKSQ